MALRTLPANCERARAWASLRLDGELSEIEDALLSAHVRRCAACREYEEVVCAVVVMLRAQPLEQIRHPMPVPVPRRTIVRPSALARVAAVAAAVVGVTTVLSTHSSNDPTGSFGSSGNVPVIATADNDIQQLRELRVIQLGGHPPQRSGVGEFGAVLSQRP
jgi:ferric-dicitrate binding protein FerR (iron transport regulator)